LKPILEHNIVRWGIDWCVGRGGENHAREKQRR